MSEFALIATPPFTVIAGRHGRDLSAPGLRLQVLKPRAMVHVIARRNKRAELGRTMQTRFGVVLPDAPILAINGWRLPRTRLERICWLSCKRPSEAPLHYPINPMRGSPSWRPA